MKQIRSITALAALLCAFSANAERREFNFSVDVHVDNTGAVTTADVVAEVAPEFEAALVKMVRGWKFQPGSRNGVPATVDTTLYTKVVAEIEKGKSATVVARYVGHGPRYLKSAPPAYPGSAQRGRYQGEIVVQAVVAVDGSTDAWTVYSAHVRGGKRAASALSKSAIEAIKNWRLQPERIDGVAVASKVLIPIKYSLQDTPVELETVIAPPAADAAQAAAIKTATEGKRALALENSTGLELVSDGSSG